uniref:Secreted protein n=1 Tax=Neolamprologus brichardi TaxID=32507 RepID=A0A3Q4GZ17_NEOBR
MILYVFVALSVLLFSFFPPSSPGQSCWRFNELEQVGDNGNASTAGDQWGDEWFLLPVRPITIKICQNFPLIEEGPADHLNHPSQRNTI